ncbi:MAG: PfkB family carbohydrate kinase [Bryobacteraceae bacterium]
MTTAEILAAFPKLRALIIGDICLDRWCRYDPALAEPSRETGLPRIAVTETETTPGAAGTIASNLVALGAGRVAVLGVVGDDGFGYELERALTARRIMKDMIVHAAGTPTFTYTKLINANTNAEDLPRVDFVSVQPPGPEIERRIIETFRDAAPRFDVILVSDQAETETGGVVTPAVRDEIARFAAAHKEKIVWVDSRLRPEHFRNAIVKPNEAEAAAASQRLCGRVDYAALRAHIAAPLLVVTQGDRGVVLIDAKGETRVPAATSKPPVDICGAGDSFSAGASLALRVTGSPAAAAAFGNRVASITIMKPGTGTASPAEILAAE